MLFKNTDKVAAYITQHKPLSRMKWVCADYHLEGETAVALLAVEKWPIDDRDPVIADPAQIRVVG